MHGEFTQMPSAHLNGQGCPKCGKLKLGAYRKNNTENFIERATLKHNGKYDYSKVDYKNNYTKVCIICPEHGEFFGFQQFFHRHSPHLQTEYRS